MKIQVAIQRMRSCFFAWYDRQGRSRVLRVLVFTRMVSLYQNRMHSSMLWLLFSYISKWVEAEPLQDQTTSSVAQSLDKLICRHRCAQMQINDLGSEFFLTSWDLNFAELRNWTYTPRQLPPSTVKRFMREVKPNWSKDRLLKVLKKMSRVIISQPCILVRPKAWDS